MFIVSGGGGGDGAMVWCVRWRGVRRLEFLCDCVAFCLRCPGLILFVYSLLFLSLFLCVSRVCMRAYIYVDNLCILFCLPVHIFFFETSNVTEKVLVVYVELCDTHHVAIYVHTRFTYYK